MGLTVLEIDVGNPADPDKTIPVEFLIDSGVVYSVVPKRTLKKLGIKPIAEEEFRLGNGTRIKRKKGGAVLEEWKTGVCAFQSSSLPFLPAADFGCGTSRDGFDTRLAVAPSRLHAGAAPQPDGVSQRRER